jgi:hypothetical protein
MRVLTQIVFHESVGNDNDCKILDEDRFTNKRFEFSPFIVSFSHLSHDSSCFGKESDSEITLQPSKTSSNTEQLIHHIIAPYSLVQTRGCVYIT